MTNGAVMTAFCGCTHLEQIPGEYTPVSRCPGHTAARAATPNRQIKVSYRTTQGYDTKAYVDEQPFAADGFHYGTNKHTDLPVRVRWDDEADTWIEEGV